MQTNNEIHGHVLIKINDKTVMGLILSEIVFNVKKKLGCIFIENHNSESLDLQRGQMKGFVTSCVAMQEDLGQRLEKSKENRQSVTGRINDAETCIGSASVGSAEKQVGKQTVYSL